MQKQRLSTWILERYTLQLATPEERQRVEAILPGCPASQKLLAELQAFEGGSPTPVPWPSLEAKAEHSALFEISRTFLPDFPEKNGPTPSLFSAEESATRSGSTEGSSSPLPLRSSVVASSEGWLGALRRWFGKDLAVAPAFALVFLLFGGSGFLLSLEGSGRSAGLSKESHPSRVPSASGQGLDPSGRNKGPNDPTAPPPVIFFAKRSESSNARILRPLDAIYPDDTLRLQVSLSRSLHLMVLSIHEGGEVSLYWPYPHEEAERLEAGEHKLPKDSSIPLDTTTGQEIFLVVGHEKAFSFSRAKTAALAAYRQTAGKLSNLPPLQGFSRQTTLLLSKRMP